MKTMTTTKTATTNTTAKALLMLLVLTALVSALWASILPTAHAVNTTAISVDLLNGKENARENYRRLTDAFSRANGVDSLTVTIGKNGVYYVDGGKSALRLCSMTTLNLNGATLMRSGEQMGNLIQVSDRADKKNDRIGGYELAHHVTIKNGTLDGKAGSTLMSNLVNIGHARNVTIDHVTMKNARGSHLLELNACRDTKVTYCTFDGFLQASDKNEYSEALQIDIAGSDSKGKWNGVYLSDNTPCENITVDHCTFKSFPGGVGNHHTLVGNHSKNITISNNTFTNTSAAKCPAITAYAFDGCKITGNKITGNYTIGIYVQAGNVTISNNEIGTAKKRIACGVRVTQSGSYVSAGSATKMNEKATGSITKNTICVQTKHYAVELKSRSVFSSVSNNSFKATKKYDIHTDSTSKAVKKSGNKLTK